MDSLLSRSHVHCTIYPVHVASNSGIHDGHKLIAAIVSVRDNALDHHASGFEHRHQWAPRVTLTVSLASLSGTDLSLNHGRGHGTSGMLPQPNADPAFRNYFWTTNCRSTPPSCSSQELARNWLWDIAERQTYRLNIGPQLYAAPHPNQRDVVSDHSTILNVAFVGYGFLNFI